ncbi:hypothetical protein ACQKNO_01305 [Bacillus paramycoides]|uniref:hypothetical protein n=1 Tax=Bacillus paramycoides TaxID=2026194 RepID=UPI003CFCDA78
MREYLPFSPAKKRPLSDLDKSGKAFLPTRYESALTQVGCMQRNIGGAFQGVANSANLAFEGAGLETFTGGRVEVVVKHQVEGIVGVDGSGLEDLSQNIAQQVVSYTGGTNGAGMFGGRLNQSIKKY